MDGEALLGAARFGASSGHLEKPGAFWPELIRKRRDADLWREAGVS
jgi:hypothetical protein